MIPAGVRIFAFTETVDLRLSFDGLVRAVDEHLGEDATSGALFVFLNKRCNRIKILWFDHNGFCILYKRLHRARFSLPKSPGNGQLKATLTPEALAWMLRGIDRI
jgi:transposase